MTSRHHQQQQPQPQQQQSQQPQQHHHHRLRLQQAQTGIVTGPSSRRSESVPLTNQAALSAASSGQPTSTSTSTSAAAAATATAAIVASSLLGSLQSLSKAGLQAAHGYAEAADRLVATSRAHAAAIQKLHWQLSFLAPELQMQRRALVYASDGIEKYQRLVSDSVHQAREREAEAVNDAQSIMIQLSGLSDEARKEIMPQKLNEAVRRVSELLSRVVECEQQIDDVIRGNTVSMPWIRNDRNRRHRQQTQSGTDGDDDIHSDAEELDDDDDDIDDMNMNNNNNNATSDSLAGIRFDSSMQGFALRLVPSNLEGIATRLMRQDELATRMADELVALTRHFEQVSMAVNTMANDPMKGSSKSATSMHNLNLSPTGRNSLDRTVVSAATSPKQTAVTGGPSILPPISATTSATGNPQMTSSLAISQTDVAILERDTREIPAINAELAASLELIAQEANEISVLNQQYRAFRNDMADQFLACSAACSQLLEQTGQVRQIQIHGSEQAKKLHKCADQIAEDVAHCRESIEMYTKVKRQVTLHLQYQDECNVIIKDAQRQLDELHRKRMDELDDFTNTMPPNTPASILTIVKEMQSESKVSIRRD
ncbi:hypothetical protein GQ42DRAFT_160272 [Ramicandelaber brevisporus]|nr:hypothetical protein GQ42DRAFT_160272 [Ramicandelaber brevisporus]